MLRAITFALLAFLVSSSIARHVSVTARLRIVEDLPKLTLPWGTWVGEHYGEDKQTILFRNVRFGQAPIGALRFAAPKYPEPKKNQLEIQDTNYGPNCIGVIPGDKKNVSSDPIAEGLQSEDCLFLDVYVPAWRFDPDVEEEGLPTVVLFYGGAYIFGGKNATAPKRDDVNALINVYDGHGIREASQENVIWVVGNYRMGAYGFLAGSTMESHGQPNAGLHDQRLLLDWVQQYIGSVGGNKSDVAIWGSSAGAGSIMHHLTAYGGTKNENLFQRAALFSPGFQWAYDRSGTLEDTFKAFTNAAGCSGSGASAVECLRKAGSNDDKLAKANEKVINGSLALGLFPFGPAVDNDLVPDLPAVLLKKGAKVPVESLLLSHVDDEASLFVAKWVQTPENFTAFLKLAYPGSSLSGVRDQIEKQYPDKEFDGDQNLRVRQVVADSSFVCNKRQIYKAYNKTSDIYGLQYSLPPALHGMDLFHLVWSDQLDMTKVIKSIMPDPFDWVSQFLASIWAVFSARYQRYLAGFAIAGNPNFLTSRFFTHWPKAMDIGGYIGDQLKVVATNPTGFTTGLEFQTSEEVCKFWEDIAESVSKASAKDAEASRKPGLFVQSSEL